MNDVMLGDLPQSGEGVLNNVPDFLKGNKVSDVNLPQASAFTQSGMLICIVLPVDIFW